MGEIYRATDMRLDRVVAIKVLPTSDTWDPERIQRLENEARAASSLSHPNILTVYGVGRWNSVPYIATELVDGQTLRDILSPGALPTKSLLDIAVQLADGLAAAHNAGIVHRDLTPANVMVSKDGVVKILDFGLAQIANRSAAHDDSKTMTFTAPSGPSREISGTAGYMSPEQASGGSIDFRSDQFSLGAILYEMATGRRAFSCPTAIETLCAVFRDEPAPIARIRPGVPAPLRWTIERCLGKTPDKRYESTKDLARELLDVKEHLSEVRPAPAVASLTPLGSILVALLAGFTAHFIARCVR
jgi:serine/threonine protein kinase